MQICKTLLLVAAAFALAACQTTSTPSTEKTPPPTLSLSNEQIFSKARLVLLAQLRDPDSAKISDLMRMQASDAEYVCGRVIARNGLGGYSRASKFSIRVDTGDALVAGESLGLNVWTSPCWSALPATPGDYDMAIRYFAGQDRRDDPNARILK